MPRIHLVSNLPGASALGDHLRGAGLGPTSARSADALLVLIDRPLDSGEQDVLDRARQSVPVLLAGPTLRSLPPDSPLVEASGLVPGQVTPVHELWLLPGPDGAEFTTRLGDFRPVDQWVVPDKLADDVEQLLMVRHELTVHPVCTWRPSTGLGMLTLGSGDRTLADPAYHRLIGRWLRHALGVRDAPPVRVGLLGTAESAAFHHMAVDVTEGLEMAAICDGASRPPGRGGDRAVRRIANPADLVNDSEIDLMIIATPTHTHTEWAVRALEAGKHVVVEHPFCLTTREVDELTGLAAERGLILAVHPDQRDDLGYRALQSSVRAGAIGDVLWLETFQGAYTRPPGTWHDDARVSGGAVYDRGFAPLDWILDLLAGPVEWVSATAHKRVWHHVSNADHTRILLHFASGTEAQITISDLATAALPRFHVIGTAGSIVSEVPTEPVIPGPRSGRHAERMFATPAVHLNLVAADGSRTRLPLPPAPVTSVFHNQLADLLVSGWPMQYTAEVARRVVAVMEAASQSVAADGGPVAPV
ncbi:Gfo/Idh/MocA family protein [Protofrankia coriariae]|uniref:Oxidoreductase n=1 Tax=Protofrankia coriariae TaxID=1562887 RepID=A0ABR5F1F0_9ACTN|nr:Gfo/Idh/MocA family oxidoreductase [Protofrankia coriariae]KLL10544.1 oxidoreductase [Protofrankia coriariae]